MHIFRIAYCANITFNNIFSDVAISGLTESVLPPLILNMSITASVIILFVLLARLALKKAPKIFSYVLWSVVLFRLLCPVSLPSPVSLLSALELPAASSQEAAEITGHAQALVLNLGNISASRMEAMRRSACTPIMNAARWKR